MPKAAVDKEIQGLIVSIAYIVRIYSIVYSTLKIQENHFDTMGALKCLTRILVQMPNLHKSKTFMITRLVQR